MRLWPCVKSNVGSPDVERCKHVKSRATTVYFKLGKLRRVYTYVQHMWGIIGHVTVEAGNRVGTDGAPPQYKDLQMRYEKVLFEWPNAELTFFDCRVSFYIGKRRYECCARM